MTALVPQLTVAYALIERALFTDRAVTISVDLKEPRVIFASRVAVIGEDGIPAAKTSSPAPAMLVLESTAIKAGSVPPES